MIYFNESVHEVNNIVDWTSHEVDYVLYYMVHEKLMMKSFPQCILILVTRSLDIISCER